MNFKLKKTMSQIYVTYLLLFFKCIVSYHFFLNGLWLNFVFFRKSTYTAIKHVSL